MPSTSRFGRPALYEILDTSPLAPNNDHTMTISSVTKSFDVLIFIKRTKCADIARAEAGALSVTSV